MRYVPAAACTDWQGRPPLRHQAASWLLNSGESPRTSHHSPAAKLERALRSKTVAPSCSDRSSRSSRDLGVESGVSDSRRNSQIPADEAEAP